MFVDVGPLPSAAAVAWLGYAKKVLHRARTDPGTLGFDVPEDVLADLERYVGEWEVAADATDPFRWSANVDVDVAVYLVLGFFRIAERLAAEAEERGTMAQPPEGEPFYWALVQALLLAMDRTGPTLREFADHMRSVWPGLPESPPLDGGGRPGQ